MRKICTFTQTYSDSRKELYEFHSKDVSDIDFRNNFNSNIYAFHNCSDEYVSDLLELNYFKELKNLNILRYNNTSYTNSFKETLDFLYKNKLNSVII